MVDTKQIKQLFRKHFETDGVVHIDDTGTVNVTGSVGVKVKSLPQLPVKFGKVTGHFFGEECGLESLLGAPEWVRGDFWVQYNNLQSLEGAPTHVGNNFHVFANKLTNLIHAPTHVGGDFLCYYNKLVSLQGVPEHGVKKLSLTYSHKLPLLRCLTAQSVSLGYDAPQPVADIMHKYLGQGKAGALKAAAELIRAGYKDNARW